MKKIISICILLIVIVSVKAQVNLVLSVQSQPPANYNSWSQRNEVITLLATAQANTEAVKINASLQTADGSPIAKTDITRATGRQLNVGSSTVFYAKDVLDAGAFTFTPSYQNELNKTGKLKAGTYKLTVSLVNANGQIVSNEQVKIFTILAAQLPVLIMPANEAVLNSASAQTAITFRWTPVLPRPQGVAKYKVLVFEILQDQTPMQALRANQPILDVEVRGATQYIWRPQLGITDEGHDKFIWTIRTTDGDDLPITGESTNGDAVSEPHVFSLKKGWNGRTKETDNAENMRPMMPPPSCCTGSSWGTMVYTPSTGSSSTFFANFTITDPRFKLGTNVRFKACFNCGTGCQCSMQYELLNFPSLTPVTGYSIPSSGACCNSITVPMPQPPGHYALRIKVFCNGTLCGTSLNDFFTYL